MKVRCPVTGVLYEVALSIPAFAKHPHPIVSPTVSLDKLLTYFWADWQDGKLSAEETHLFGMGVLMKLPVGTIDMKDLTLAELIVLHAKWDAVMERLVGVARKLDSRAIKLRGVPSFSVNYDNLTNLKEWIITINDALLVASAPISEKAKELNRASYKVSTNEAGRASAAMLEPEQVDSLVTRALRGSPLNTSEQRALPVILADWAQRVTQFPPSNTMRYQKLIQQVFAVDFVNTLLMNSINIEMVKSLEEHMLLNTPSEAVGTAHSTLIMRRLSEAVSVLEDFSPAVTKRRVISDDDLLAALEGTDTPTAPAKTTNNSAPKQSLAEKLAAKLAARGKNATINVGDL